MCAASSNAIVSRQKWLRGSGTNVQMENSRTGKTSIFYSHKNLIQFKLSWQRLAPERRSGVCLSGCSASFCVVPTRPGTDRSPSRRVVSIKLKVVPSQSGGRHALSRSPGAHLLEKVSRGGCAPAIGRTLLAYLAADPLMYIPFVVARTP